MEKNCWISTIEPFLRRVSLDIVKVFECGDSYFALFHLKIQEIQTFVYVMCSVTSKHLDS